MKIRKGKLLTWGYIIAAGWYLAVAHARGETMNYSSQVKSQETKYKAPEDMIEMVPVLNKLPRTLLLGQSTIIKLSPDQLRINHRTHETRTTKAEPCMIGLSYIAPMSGSLSSQINIPLFHAPNLTTLDWSRNAWGDYEVSMNRQAMDHATLKFALNARF